MQFSETEICPREAILSFFIFSTEPTGLITMTILKILQINLKITPEKNKQERKKKFAGKNDRNAQ